jgi:hypothetical protein
LLCFDNIFVFFLSITTLALFRRHRVCRLDDTFLFVDQLVGFVSMTDCLLAHQMSQNEATDFGMDGLVCVDQPSAYHLSTNRTHPQEPVLNEQVPPAVDSPSNDEEEEESSSV